MCTVTIVPHGGGIRIVCNRDERRSRAGALPPVARSAAAGSAIYPIDPLSGGTWIGANDGGLAAVLLNRTPACARGRAAAPRSRGLIVPALLECRSIDAAVAAAAALDCRQFEPFLVVLVGLGRGVALTSGAARCARASFDPARPHLFTSSSLGDDLVEPPRRMLFERLVVGAGDRLAGQLRFHEHQWPHAPHLSVRMQRDAAATVSRTTIDLGVGGVRMAYVE